MNQRAIGWAAVTGVFAVIGVLMLSGKVAADHHFASGPGTLGFYIVIGLVLFPCLLVIELRRGKGTARDE